MNDPLEGSHTAPKFAAPAPAIAAEWYMQHLGFKGRVFGTDYAIVRRGALTLHLWPCPDRHIAENTSCYVELGSVEQLDRLHAEWLTASKQDSFAPGRIEAAPQDRHGHGMREFHVWDPAGNLLGFGAALPSDQ